MDKKGLIAANDGHIIDLSYLVLLWRSLFSYCQTETCFTKWRPYDLFRAFLGSIKAQTEPEFVASSFIFCTIEFFAMTKFFFLIEKKLKPLLIERVCIDDGTSGFLRPRRDFRSRNLCPEKRKIFHSLEMQVAYWSAAMLFRCAVGLQTASRVQISFRKISFSRESVFLHCWASAHCAELVRDWTVSELPTVPAGLKISIGTKLYFSGCCHDVETFVWDSQVAQPGYCSL